MTREELERLARAVWPERSEEEIQRLVNDIASRRPLEPSGGDPDPEGENK